MKFENPLSKQKFYRPTIDRVPDIILELLLYAACFFPFVQIVYIGSDTQPYGMLAAMLVVIVCWIRSARMTKAYGVIALCGIGMGAFALIMLLQENVYMAFRSYFSYLTLIFVPLAVYLMMKKHGGMNDTLTKAAIWIWFIVGFVQKYIRSDFGYSLTARHTTGGTRGAVSLASEPSAYGYICIFLILIALRLKKHAKFYVLNLMIQIIVFATSSVALVYIAVYIAAYMLNELLFHKKYAVLKTALVAGGGIGGLWFIAKFVPPTNRMGALVNFLFHEPQRLIQDESIVMRAEAITYSFRSFYENHFLPHGMNDYRLMTGVGSLIYECGFVAVIILAAIAVIIWKSYPKGINIFYTLGFLLIMFSSIPFSSPIVGFYIGQCLYEAVKKDREKVVHAETLPQKPGETVWYCGKLYREKQNESIMDM
mgnify:CR=1 FL=1